MRHAMRLPAMTVLLIGAVACGGEKKAAEEALARAEDFTARFTDQATKVLPEAVKQVQDSLEKTKALMTAGDFKTARTAAIDVSELAVGYAKTVVAKQAERDSVYKVISFEVTGMVRQCVDKTRQLLASGRLPKGATKEQFDSLREVISGWEGEWNKAREFRKNGEIGNAYLQANAVKKSVADAMQVLGLGGS